MIKNYVFGHSRLTRKMIVKILLAEMSGMIITFLLALIFIFPSLKNQTLSGYKSSTQALTKEIASSISSLTDSSYYIRTSRQLINQLDIYYDHPSELNTLKTNLVLNNLISSSSYIRCVYLESPDGTSFNSIQNFRDEDMNFLASEAYKNMLDQDFKSMYTQIYTVDVGTDMYTMAFCQSFILGTKNFTLTVFYNVNSLVNSVQTLSGTVFESAYLCNDNTCFYSINPNDTFEETFASVPTTTETQYDTGSGYYFTDYMSVCGWTFFGYVSDYMLMHQYIPMILLTSSMYLILAVITIFILTLSMQQLIRPINQLNHTIQYVSMGDFSHYSDIQTNDEISELSDVYNQMLSNLNQLMDESVAHKLNEAQMEYNLLVAQIDSHFICNTMHIINSLARSGEMDDVISINTALSKILENCLRVKKLEITDTLHQEINLVKQYWIIENMRYDNQAELIWDVDETLEDIQIPKNILQPFVENSLTHGLYDEITGIIKGKIVISIHETDNRIQISIADNGIGISNEYLEFLNHPADMIEQINERGRHVGMINVRKRLTYIYHDAFTFNITSGHGVTVTMTFPSDTPHL